MEQSFVLQLTNRQIQDFYLCFCGYEKCDRYQSFGPAVRPNYIVHYILEGEGDYVVEDRRYHLKAGQGFLIEPNTVTFYRANPDNPWTYVWVGFSGPRAPEYLYRLGYNHNHLIFQNADQERMRSLVFEMLRHNKNSLRDEFYLHGLFYEFISYMVREEQPQQYEPECHRENINRYLREAVAYIQRHFSEGLQVADIAREVAVSRVYLYQIFNETLGVSPKEYLTNFCITRATELLTLSGQPVEEVAESCGFKNPAAFSAIFKRRMGVTPTKYRNSVPAIYRERLQKELQSLCSSSDGIMH
ncbi:MAG: AraC family transcriptional regulator [Lachnospiraceae bacterium]|nr:AraC family transcriptional regulator [Lachnospiraceae bacterium]MCI9283311.1 AraC family transcriptional regulator [Lachnospiraceae bacterium]